MKERIIKFLNSVFTEVDGSGSATRVLAGASVAATLAWVSYLVVKNGTLPDLGGASLFVSAGFSGYAVNKVSRALSGNDTKGQ